MTLAEEDFRKELLQNYEKCKDIGYDPHIYLAMISQHGAIEAAKRLVNDPAETSYGLEVLWEKSHLELTAEATMLRPQFRSLFSPQEVKRARQILKDHHYTAPWDIGPGIA